MLIKNFFLIGFIIFPLQFIGLKMDFIKPNTTIEKKEIKVAAEKQAIITIENRENNFFNDNGVCWRESYGRGAGVIPTGCPPGYENDAGLCYKICKPGYAGAGPMCWRTCPEGYRDDGAYCNKPGNGEAYGRGGGFPWKFGDAFNLDAAMKRCEAEHGKGNCEKCLEIIYPKCKSGFRAVGCNICTSVCPEGMKDNGVSCHKDSYGRGVGLIPTGCPSGKVNQGGLCYTPCKNGMKGIGPVCWDIDCPDNYPISCGASCAETTNHCISATLDQVMSPLELVITIAEVALTAGTATAIKKGVQTASKAGVKATTKNIAKSMAKKMTKKAAREALEKGMKESGKYLTEAAIEEAATMMIDASAQAAFHGEVQGLDVDWEDLAILDPTGITNIVLAYANPLCKDVKGPARAKQVSQPIETSAHVPDKPDFGDMPARKSISELTGKFVRFEHGKDRINVEKHLGRRPIHDGAWSAMWILEPVEGKYFRIKNKWRTNEALHVKVADQYSKKGTLEFSEINPTYKSGHWYFEAVGANSYIICNRWTKTMIDNQLKLKTVSTIDVNSFWNINLVN